MTILGIDAVLFWLCVMGYFVCAWIVAIIPWPRYRVAEECRRSMSDEEVEAYERLANRIALGLLMALAPLVLGLVACVGVWAIVSTCVERTRGGHPPGL